jgi:CBS domain-containing protein
MTSPVESLTPGAEAVDAARIMVDERIRCLPIVDGRHVVGILTRRDLLEAGVVDTRPSEREPNY